MKSAQLIIQGFKNKHLPVPLKLIATLNLLFCLLAGGAVLLWVLASMLKGLANEVNVPGDPMTAALTMTIAAAISVFGIVVTGHLLQLNGWARTAQCYWYAAAALWAFFYGLAESDHGPRSFGADRFIAIALMVAAIFYLRSAAVEELYVNTSAARTEVQTAPSISDEEALKELASENRTW